MDPLITVDEAAPEGAGDALRPLHPVAPRLWRVVSVPVALAAGALGLVVAIAGGAGILLLGAVAAVALVVVVWSWWYPVLRYRHWRYRVGDEAIELRQGVWFRTRSSVPFHRLQQIDVEQGPLQRRHGVVTLHLRTAAAATVGQVPHLAATDADVLRDRLLAAARAAVAADDGH